MVDSHQRHLPAGHAMIGWCVRGCVNNVYSKHHISGFKCSEVAGDTCLRATIAW